MSQTTLAAPASEPFDHSHGTPAAAWQQAPVVPVAPGAGQSPPGSGTSWLKIVLPLVGTLLSVLVAVFAWVGVGTSVPADSVATQLTQQYGATVSCTEDLPAEIGAAITCTGVDDEGAHQLRVTATSVEGSTVGFEAVPLN